MEENFVESVSDARVVNNTARHQYRILTEAEKAAVTWFKDLGVSFDEYCSSFPTSREMEIARMKMEEAVMWAVKGITK